MTNARTAVPAALSPKACDEVEQIQTHKTDCWGVHDALAGHGPPRRAPLDVRDEATATQGHIEGAVSLPCGIVGSRHEGFRRIPIERGRS